jgi:CubicO group peptidase (beta-lactamase class C family)
VELADLIDRHDQDGAPGHVIGVYSGGELIAHESSGLAVLEHDVPIGPDTAFDIASSSKQFTATCLVLLERDGLLSLDDDVRTHLPELSLQAPVTLRQCLSHTGGLRDYLSLLDLAGVPSAGMHEAKVLPMIAGQRELNFAPGTGWSYSNTGFVLAAAIVRRVTGASLAEFAAARLFGPLGMQATRFRDDLAVPVRSMATGYSPEGGGWRRVDLLEETVGDGALVTTVADLAGWQRFMLTGAVLGTEVRDALLSPAVLTDGQQRPYALGLEIATIGPHRFYLHSGWIDGFRSALGYLLDQGLGVAVLANRDDTFPAEIAARVAERLAGVAAPVQAPRLGGAAGHAAQRQLEGLWYAAETDSYLALAAGDDGSVEHAEGETVYRYLPLADGSWQCVQGAPSIRLRLEGSNLRQDEVFGDEPPVVYRRPAAVDAPPAVPDGIYFSEELHAYATLQPAGPDASAGPGGLDAGLARLAVGLAKPVTLPPVGAAEWAGEGLTVRLVDGGAALEISCDGALRSRFRQVPGPVPVLPLGLTEPD